MGMIILSVGMPRAGSGWCYNLTNDLLLANGAADAHQIRSQFHLQHILTEVNCNIGALTLRRLSAVLLPSLLGNTFVIKAHSSPTSFASWIIRRGQIRPSYIFRDPRDALLSAMENGQRAIERGRPNAFSPFAEFDAALLFMEKYLITWEQWTHVAQALLIRYENLLLEYDIEVERLAQFLGLEVSLPRNREIIERYRPENSQTDQKGLHFRHGKIGRFRHKLSVEQQELMADRLGGFIERMGYVL